jgi:hypothetical protein
MDDATETSASESPRKSSESFDSRGTQKGYYFLEHLSQAFTAPPIDLSDEPKPRSHSHKHNASIDSTSSTSSTGRLKRLVTEALSAKSAPFWRPAQRTTDESAYTMKGSKKTFRKEDIKVGELTASSNMLHLQ